MATLPPNSWTPDMPSPRPVEPTVISGPGAAPENESACPAEARPQWSPEATTTGTLKPWVLWPDAANLIKARSGIYHLR